MFLTKKEILIKNGFLTLKDISQRSYSFQKIGAAQLNLGLFLKNKPYWQYHTQKNEHYIPKKIILNNWIYLFHLLVIISDKISNKFLTQSLLFLFSYPFEIYIFNNKKQLIKINHLDDLHEKANDFYMFPDNESAIAHLIKMGIGIKEYQFLDIKTCIEISLAYKESGLYDLKPYIESIQEKLDSFNPALEIYNYNELLHYRDHHEKLIYLCENKLVKKIIVESDNYKYSWENNFSAKELKIFFSQLISNDISKKIILSDSFRLQLRHLTISDKQLESIDLTLFPNLTSLTLDGHTAHISGLHKLKYLNKLNIYNEQLIDIQLSKSNLTHFEFDWNKRIPFPTQSINISIPALQNLVIDDLFLKNKINIAHDPLNIKKISYHDVELSSEDFSNLSVYKNLEQLLFIRCKFSPNTFSLPYLPHLRFLQIFGCNAIKGNLNLELSESLETIDLHIDGLIYSELKKNKKLKKIYLSMEENSVLDLSEMSLEHITVYGKLKEIDLSHCSELRYLLVSRKPRLKGIESCLNLKELILDELNPNQLPIKTLEQIETLCLDKNPYPPYDVLKNLKKLTLRNAKTFPLPNLKVNIEVLKIYSADDAHLDFSNFPNLKSLDISSCKNLESINITSCKLLKTLELSNCEKLTIAPKDLTDEIYFICNYCPNIPSILIKKGFKLSRESRKISLPSDIFKRKNYAFNTTNTITDIFKSLVSGNNTQYDEIDPTDQSEKSALPSIPNNMSSALLTSTYTSPTSVRSVYKIFYPTSLFQLTPDPSNYRWQIFDGISLENNYIKQEPANIFDDYEEVILPKFYQTDYSTYRGIYPYEIFANEKTVLPDLSSKDKLLSVSHQDKIKIFRSKITRQYFIIASENISNFTYLIKQGKNYFIDDINNSYSNPEKRNLPVELIVMLDELAKTKNNIVHSIANTKDFTKKTNLLINYCRQFENKALATNDLYFTCNSLRTLLNDNKGKGACAIRSFVFIILSLYFKLPIKAEINKNQIHAFGIVTDNLNISHGIDLGGGSVKLKVHEVSEKKSASNYAISTEKKMHVIENIKNGEFIHKEKWNQLFSPEMIALKNSQTLNEFIFNAANHGFPLLIRVRNENEIQQLYLAFLNYFKSKNEPIIYISCADDLLNTYETVHITDNEFNEIDGPVKLYLKESKGRVIINWTDFTKEQRAIYKSIMDKKQTLGDIEFTMPIIGFILKNEVVNDVFLTRCDEIELPTHFIFEEQQTSYLGSEDSNIPVINLFHSENWATFLVENSILDGNDLINKPGPLITAMIYGNPIAIRNPPLHDKSFNQFWQTLIAEGKVIFNGKTLQAKEGFCITIKNHNDFIQKPECFQQIEIPDPNKKIYNVSASAFDSLFEIQIIDEQGKNHFHNGLLQQCQDNEQIIFDFELSTDHLQRIYAELEKLKKTTIINYSIKCKPECKTISELEFSENIHVETNDPYFYIKTIQDKLDIANHNIFYLKENNWSELIEDIQLSKVSKKIYISRKELSFIKKLMTGETVILSGEMNEHEFENFSSLFKSPAELLVNGSYVYPSGRLIWVSEPLDKLKAVKTIRLIPDFLQYKNQLKTDIPGINEEILTKLELYLQLIQLMDKGNFKLNSSQFTYQKCKAICEYAVRYKHKQNPIKAIINYFYAKNSEEYAFLNVLAKILFSKNPNNYVFRNKLNRYNLKDYKQAELHPWKILNCFSAVQLKSAATAIVDTIKHGHITDSIHALLKTFHNFIPKDTSNNRYETQKHELITVLKDETKDLIFITGEAGTGKTHLINELAMQINQHKPYTEKSIEQFFNDTTSPIPILLLDEGNMLAPGHWEYLRAKLSGKRKIVITGNPATYLGCHFHHIIWERAHVIWFGALQPNFIKSFVHARLVTHLNEENINLATEIIFNTYDYLLKEKSLLIEISLREIVDICFRLIHNPNKYKIDMPSFIAQTIYDEVSGIFTTVETRQKFKLFLEKNVSLLPELTPPLINDNNDFILTKEKEYVWRLIYDDLDLREINITNKINQGRKLGTLIEGPSGVGKTTIFIQALEQRGFSQYATDPQKRYYLITAGSLNIEKILLKALNEGSIVVLDELNLAPNIILLLNKLLQGCDLDDNPAIAAGFHVFTSENPSYYLGCNESSRAIISRLHKIDMDDYSENELLFIGKKLKHPTPERLVKFYLELRKIDKTVNARSFFRAAKRRIPILEPIVENVSSSDNRFFSKSLFGSGLNLRNIFSSLFNDNNVSNTPNKQP